MQARKGRAGPAAAAAGRQRRGPCIRQDTECGQPCTVKTYWRSWDGVSRTRVEVLAPCTNFLRHTKHDCTRYLDTMAELRRYAACFHLLDDPPRTLAVDDISDFLDSRRALAKTAFDILSLHSQTAR